jgi:hypothetical protein
MSKSKAQQAKRNYSECLGEDRGDRYLSQQGYTNRLNDKQKGIKQGHDAVYIDPRTRSLELDKSAQIVRERQQGGYSKLQVKEAQRDLKHHHRQHGHIPSNQPEVVVAEFKGGTSKESKLQQQPDWSTNVAKDIRDRQYRQSNPAYGRGRKSQRPIHRHETHYFFRFTANSAIAIPQ